MRAQLRNFAWVIDHPRGPGVRERELDWVLEAPKLIPAIVPGLNNVSKD